MAIPMSNTLPTLDSKCARFVGVGAGAGAGGDLIIISFSSYSSLLPTLKSNIAQRKS
jgi:hypothetical protein